MSDIRSKIQLARIQDDAWLWGTLVTSLMQENLAEGIKAALSGATRGTPGGRVKRRATELVVENLARYAELDLRAANDAAVTAAIYSAPESETRARATEFVVANLETLAGIDARQAVDNSKFALSWATPGSEAEREAARIWSSLSVDHPGAEAEKTYPENDILDQDMDEGTSARSA